MSPRLHTPIWSCVAIGALSAVPFIQFAGAAVIAVGATASIYLSYFLGNIAVMRARATGWPKTTAPFSLGGWGKVVNALALLWGGSMLVNFLWPASGKSGANSFRIFSNPRAVETDYGFGPASAPCLRLITMLATNTSTPAARMKAPIVVTRLTVFQPRPSG